MPKIIAATIIAVLLFVPGAAATPLEARGNDGPTALASAYAGRIVVGGRPYFPVMALGQCSEDDIAQARAAGITLFVSGECPSVSPEELLSRVPDDSLAVLPIEARNLRGDAIAGWTYPDEPENNHWTPESLAAAHPYPRESADGLLSFMTTGSGFFGPPQPGNPPRDTYRDFARLADVAGFDLYPLGHCDSDLASVYDAQRDFVRLVAPMPTFQWIETGPIVPTYCGGFQMQPDELRAEVWLAITGGANGIGYFTQTFSPEHRAFDVRPPLVAEMQRTNGQLLRLTPGLVGDQLAASADSGAIRSIARKGNDGRVYVFAVNSTRDHVKAQLRVPALGEKQVDAFDERRSLPARNGNLIDDFAPLGVHLYVSR